MLKEKKKKTTTLKAIAEEIGISPAVVTRTLRNTSSKVPISKSTKQRILEVAMERGIRLNDNIGIFIGETIAGIPEYCNTYISGIFSRAEKYAAGIKSCFYKSGEKSLKKYNFLYRREISGAIFLHEIPQMFKDFLTEEMIPYVLINPIALPGKHDCILVDDYGAMLSLLTELDKQGYTRYVLVTYDLDSHYTKRRIECLNSFVDKKGYYGKSIAIKENNILPGEFEEEARNSTQGTVFIADARFFTIKLLEFFAVYGKRMPEDIGLVGNRYIAEYYEPKLTYLNYPLAEMGKAAVDMIQEKWKKCNKPINNIILKGEIVPGGSTKSQNK